MSCPRIEVDLGKIRHNTQTLVAQLEPRGIGVTAVTKAVCGHPAIAQAMLDGGAVGLADARISNVQRLRAAGITDPITLIRTPMLSQSDQVVQSCETSYNTDILVISALATAAISIGSVHGIVLMVEMGDGRDGILPQNLAEIAQRVMQMSGVALKGIGANFACLNGGAPTGSQMTELCDLANELEGICGPYLRIVSGGNSANLPWALGDNSTGRVNELRLGEAILLGIEPVSGEPISGMHLDSFMLVAEVIEIDAKPSPFPVMPSNQATAPCCIEPSNDAAPRMILAIGHQDTDIPGLSMPAGCRLLGATSDHLIIGTSQTKERVGSEVRFQMNYKAFMQAMAAPDIEVKLLDDRPWRQLHARKARASHLSLA